MNKVYVLGHLTRDPELKSLPSGNKVVNFGVATNRSYKTSDGERKEDVEFHNIVAFGKQAESTAQFLKKGSQALIEGRLQTRSWDNDGQKHYRTEIVADHITFGRKQEGTAATQDAPQQAEKKPDVDKQWSSVDKIEYPDEEINPDDIPF